MTTIVYYLEDARSIIDASYTAYISGRHWSEDGCGYRIDEARAFSIESQSEMGYFGELREPFSTEAASAMMLDDCGRDDE